MTIPHRGHEPDQLAGGSLIPRELGDLRAEVAVQPREFQPGMADHSLHRLGRGTRTQREAELLVVRARRHRPVDMRVHAWRDTDQDPLTGRGQCREADDLGGAVHRDAPRAIAEGRLQVPRGLRVPVHDDPLGGEVHRTRHRQFAGRADVQ